MVAEMKVMQTPSGPPGGTGSDANFSIVENVSSADNHHQMTPPAAAAFGAKKRGRPRKGTPTTSTGKSILVMKLCISGHHFAMCTLWPLFLSEPLIFFHSWEPWQHAFETSVRGLPTPSAVQPEGPESPQQHNHGKSTRDDGAIYQGH